MATLIDRNDGYKVEIISQHSDGRIFCAKHVGAGIKYLLVPKFHVQKDFKLIGDGR